MSGQTDPRYDDDVIGHMVLDRVEVDSVTWTHAALSYVRDGVTHDVPLWRVVRVDRPA